MPLIDPDYLRRLAMARVNQGLLPAVDDEDQVNKYNPLTAPNEPNPRGPYDSELFNSMVPDLSSEYNTPLTETEQAEFDKWLPTSGRASGSRAYDLQGYWKAMKSGDQWAQEGANGHLPDAWKKPNYPTFSEESYYSSDEHPGGRWLQAPDGSWSFLPGDENLKSYSPEDLKTYFKNFDPDARLDLPKTEASGLLGQDSLDRGAADRLNVGLQPAVPMMGRGPRPPGAEPERKYLMEDKWQPPVTDWQDKVRGIADQTQLPPLADRALSMVSPGLKMGMDTVRGLPEQVAQLHDTGVEISRGQQISHPYLAAFNAMTMAPIPGVGAGRAAVKEAQVAIKELQALKAAGHDVEAPLAAAMAQLKEALGGQASPVVRRASADEITQAAASSHDLTQQGLRDRYAELGLSGLPPSDFVKPSIAAQQPQEVVEAAKALKLEDRAALNTLTPAQRMLFVKGKPVIVEGETFRLPSQIGSEEAAKARAPLTKEVKKAEIQYDQHPHSFGRPLFDLSAKKLTQLPDVDQFPLPRLEPKITERLKPAFSGGAGLKRLERAAAKANPEMWGWYNLEQTRRDFHYIHGPELGQKVYEAWLDSLAGTSMLNPISNNVRSSSYYLKQLAEGKPLPELVKVQDPNTGKMVSTLAGGPPSGYGAKSEVQHAQRVGQFLRNEGDPVKNAKPMSYRQNLGGNWMPRTVDTHDIRNAVGMPYAKTAFSEENSALLPGEYSALEGLGQKAADRAGTPQAPQQAGTWIGGGDYTGLKSVPLPVQHELNRRIMVTAKVYGMKPADVYSKFLRGEMMLLSAVPFSLGGSQGEPPLSQDGAVPLAAQG